MDQKLLKIILLAVIIVLTLGGGYFLYHFGYLAGQISGQNKEAALAQQEQAQIIQEIFGTIAVASLNGRITEVHSDKKYIIVAVPSAMGVNIPKIYQNKEVSVKDGAKITLKETKTPEIFNKEMQDYQAKIKKSGGMNTMSFSPPFPYSEKEITINDLKAGDNISFNLEYSGASAILLPKISATQISVIR